jgi:hypothetical protein
VTTKWLHKINFLVEIGKRERRKGKGEKGKEKREKGKSNV